MEPNQPINQLPNRKPNVINHNGSFESPVQLPPVVVPDGLILHLSAARDGLFDEGGVTELINGLPTEIVNGSPTFIDVAGDRRAWNFQNGEHIDIQDFSVPRDEFSVFARFRTANNASQTLMSEYLPTDRGFLFWTDNERLRTFYQSVGGSFRNGDLLNSTGLTQLTDGTWRTAGATFQGGTIATNYFDGVRLNSDVTVPALMNDSAAPFSVGAWNGTNSLFIGLIDEIRVYDRALNDDEHEELNNDVFTR